MKGFGRVIIVLVVFLAVVIMLLQLASTARRQALESKQESTLAILERLGELEHTTPPREPHPGRGPPQETGEISQVRVEENESEEHRQDLPPLKRAPNADEIAQRFRPEQGAARTFAAIRLGFAKRMDGVFYALKPKKCKVNAVAIASEALSIGDLDTARTYFREGLEADAPPRIHKNICAQLAWLEDDPRVIEKLLERACAGDDYDYALFIAARLADVTGSVELRDHYVERLRKVNPEMAGAFDK